MIHNIQPGNTEQQDNLIWSARVTLLRDLLILPARSFDDTKVCYVRIRGP